MPRLSIARASHGKRAPGLSPYVLLLALIAMIAIPGLRRLGDLEGRATCKQAGEFTKNAEYNTTEWVFNTATKQCEVNGGGGGGGGFGP